MKILKPMLGSYGKHFTPEQWKDEETEKVYTTVRVVSAGYNGGKKKDKSGLPF